MTVHLYVIFETLYDSARDIPPLDLDLFLHVGIFKKKLKLLKV